MDKLLQIIEKILHQFIGEINLYMVFANVFKYLFVIIVLYFSYDHSMIYPDIGQLRGTGFREDCISSSSPEEKLPLSCAKHIL